MMRDFTYYAVRNAAPGRSRGVYLNEDAAILNTDYHYPWRPFKELAKAEKEVYRFYNNQRTQFWDSSIHSHRLRAVVHVAGWAVLNDLGLLKAGGGIYWGAKNPQSVHNRAFLIRGVQDQKRGQIWAVAEAVRLARREHFMFLTVITDSSYLMHCVCNWLGVWRANNWLDEFNQSVPYREDLEELFKMMQLFGHHKIQMEYIEPESGNVGSEQAKYLALRGARRVLNGDYCLPWVR